MNTLKVGRSKVAKARKSIKCDQCEAAMINGVFCLRQVVRIRVNNLWVANGFVSTNAANVGIPCEKARRVAMCKNCEFFGRKPISKELATKRLLARFEEQALLFPTMRNYMTAQQYVSANIGYTMRHGLLASYDA